MRCEGEDEREGTGLAAGFAGALVLGLPLLLLAGTGGSVPGPLCVPDGQVLAQHAAGPDSAAAGGPHISMPLAEADVAPPVPPESIVDGLWPYPVPAPATISARFGQDGPHWSSRHTGTDWAAPAGTPVLAATNGVVLAVVDAADGHPFGTFVTVPHADNVVTVYAHLESAAVVRGQELTGGQQLGTVGSTGNSTGPHLHFEVRPQISGRHLPVDPEPYLAGAALPAAGPQMVPVADCAPLVAADAMDTSHLPDLSRHMTPTIVRTLEEQCPELPLAWVYAQVMAESSWSPSAWCKDSKGGAAGLYQLSAPVWASVEAGIGSWRLGTRPPEDHPVWQPAVHPRIGITHVRT